MSGIIRQFAEAVDAISESRAPYDTLGANPPTEVYERRLADLHNLVRNPVFSVDDIVSRFFGFICAIMMIIVNSSQRTWMPSSMRIPLDLMIVNFWWVAFCYILIHAY